MEVETLHWRSSRFAHDDARLLMNTPEFLHDLSREEPSDSVCLMSSHFSPGRETDDAFLVLIIRVLNWELRQFFHSIALMKDDLLAQLCWTPIRIVGVSRQKKKKDVGRVMNVGQNEWFHARRSSAVTPRPSNEGKTFQAAVSHLQYFTWLTLLYR